jgi:uncharacterized membrane protein
MTSSPLAAKRLHTIDWLRGFIMVVMALDHTRDFFHIATGNFEPTDLSQTNVPLFYTRIITHICAPTFVLLSGISVWLSSQKKSKRSLALFLLTRGIWLILLEFTIVRFSFFFNMYYDLTILQVIWAIGVSMVLLSGLIFLSRLVLLAISFILILFLTLSPILGDSFSFPYVLNTLLFSTNVLTLSPEHTLVVGYPVVPWLVVMILGYCMGPWFREHINTTERIHKIFITGIILTTTFMVLRFINVGGDPTRWESYPNISFTIMSFLNTSKYPPSLLYLCMTLGPMLLLLASIEKWNMRSFVLETFGRVPLFYYIIHFYIIHLVALVFYMVDTGTSWKEIDFHVGNSFGGLPASHGYSLWVVYLVWISIVVALYPLCRWYAHYKATHRSWWLGYL